MQKIVVFVVFYSLIFVLLVGFCLWLVFSPSKSFHKKKETQNCPDSLIYNTTDVYPYQPAYWISNFWTHLLLIAWIVDHLWEPFLFVRIFLNPWEFLLFMRIFLICDFLSFYENKLVYKSQHLKHIFYHQNMIMIFCWFGMLQVYVFCLEFFSFYV